MSNDQSTFVDSTGDTEAAGLFRNFDVEVLTFRLQLRKLARQNKEKRKDIRTILRDDDMFNLAYLDIGKGYVATANSFQDFLDYLIENQDEIFRLIARIIELFA